MDPLWEPTREPTAEESVIVYQKLDELRMNHDTAEQIEAGRLVSIRLKLRELARLHGLARLIGTSYQTLIQEFIVEGLARREAQLGLKARGVEK